MVEETDVSVQIRVCICGFLEVAAIRYNEKKTRQRWTKMWFLWFRDKKEQTVRDSSTESAVGTRDSETKQHADTSSNQVVSCEYLINRLQGHPVHGLDSNGSFLLRFYNDMFAILWKVFQRFLNRKFENPFERFFGLGHICFQLILLFSGCWVMHEKQISDVIVW